jgi:propionate CoA-transferase
VELENGEVRFREHGKPKLVEHVAQITFSGRYARELGQEVLYVSEAAVFRLTPEGVRLEEVAPGVDIERDLLPQLGFKPLMREPVGLMAPELFVDQPLPLRLFRHYAE